MNRIAEIVTIAIICALLAVVPVADALAPDLEVSVAERRRLADMPEFTVKTVFDGSAASGTEKYLLDRFFVRDGIRTLTAAVRFGVLRQRDSGGIFIADGSAVKLEYVFNEKSVVNAAAKLNAIYDKYLIGEDGEKIVGDVYYSIIPDKTCLLAEANGFPSIKYADFERVMTENAKNMTFIPIEDCLDGGDYYTTDPHWRQERIGDVARRLGEAMGFTALYDEDDFEAVSLSPFKGAYYGQSALPLPPDTLVYMTNPVIENARYLNYETNETRPVYAPEDFSNVDPYDVYLGGAAALLEITNPNADGGHLIVFRDSFGSSLVPLLINEYVKITLVDIRYIITDYVGEFVDFTDADVLFIYSTSVLNSSGILR